MNFEQIVSPADFKRWSQALLYDQIFYQVEDTLQWEAETLLVMMKELDQTNDQVKEWWSNWLCCIIEQDQETVLAQLLNEPLTLESRETMMQSIATNLSLNCLKLVVQSLTLTEEDRLKLLNFSAYQTNSRNYLLTLEELGFDLSQINLDHLIINLSLLTYLQEKETFSPNALLLTVMRNPTVSRLQWLLSHGFDWPAIKSKLKFLFLLTQQNDSTKIEVLKSLLEFGLNLSEIFAVIHKSVKNGLIKAICTNSELSFFIAQGLTKEHLLVEQIGLSLARTAEELQLLSNLGLTLSDLLAPLNQPDDLFDWSSNQGLVTGALISAWHELGLAPEVLRRIFLRKYEPINFTKDPDALKVMIELCQLTKAELKANWFVRNNSDNLVINQILIDYAGFERSDFNKTKGLIFPDEILVKAAHKLS